MERLQCKACGSLSMLPMEMEPDETDSLGFETDQEARFFTCHVCGDNWLTVRRTEEGDCQVTFVHQMGLQPLLKRVAYVSTPVVINENTVDRWDYFFGEDAVGESEWLDRLDNRRRVLRSICSN